MSDSSGHFLHRPKAPLPDATDFDPGGGGLDPRHAWKNFGGLSLVQAHELFLRHPGYYQEDFMFMGPKAFAYYFPVIDRFLRDWAESSDDSVDNCAWILACAMIAQMEITGPAALAIATVSEIAGLAAFVIQEADRYTDDILERKRLVKEWRKVKRICAELLPAL